MDRVALLRELERAEAHVRSGEVELRNLDRAVQNLHDLGRPTRLARKLRRTCRDLQRLHIATRDRVARELRDSAAIRH